MKRRWMFAGIALTFAAGIVLGNTVLADSGTGQPGSVDDPVVTKSYVDQQLAEKLKNAPTAPTTPTGSLPIKVVTLNPGQSLIAFEGTEVIVRNGWTSAIGSANGGIPDLTGGKDLANEVTVPLNHLLLFPRSDNRGVKMSPKASGKVYMMVRGAYEIRNADGTVAAGQ